MLSFRDLTYRIAGRVLLDHVSATIPAGHKVGLVGRNGTGKSTLFRIICGELQTETGGVELPNDCKIAKLPQEPPGGSQTPIQYVLAADTEREALLAEAEELENSTSMEDAERIATVHMRLAEIDAHSAPARAAVILAGLGFDEEMQNRPLDSFSGGWRMRVALAGCLFSNPDLLLLDEPTNHLDLEASLWLEGYLKSWPRTFLLISHDRHFLNSAVEHILHIDNTKLVLYRGNYDDFETERRLRMEQQTALAQRQAEQRKHLQDFVDRFRAKASKARQAQSRLKMLAKMQPIAAAVEDPTVIFRLPDPEELPPPLIVLDNLTAGYVPDKPVLRHVDLRIDMEDRIAMLGANGNGKSTLAKILAGTLKPQAGQIRRSGKLRIGYFAQDQDEVLDESRTPVDHLADLMPNATVEQLRTRLGGFGLTREKAQTAAGKLSGGERARLLFAMVTHHAPHLLILDEPTNHLDMDTRDALVQAVNEFKGAVILVSHDRHMAEACADRFWLVADGTVKDFDGDLDDYARYLADKRRAAATVKLKGGGNSETSAADRKAERKQAAAARQALAPLRIAVQSAEKALARLNAEKMQLDATLADPDTYTTMTPAKLAELQKQHGEIVRKIEAAEETWLEAQAKLEEAQSEAA
ncbi:MAG TPA: ABC-F family ATP-binding cassette domain-containing protein [Ferrovibrio sp.]|jgi:ATP-binding cassette subfamily F protein 3|uniref:ABC-F family ATP-binding cassette domain-containing protein n=1 Tax=Ferrovibrio sp. TaxID=1917215 RepID=UPI002B4AF8A7|nr:ABC-F family ATP-binding cassette domain-containing protein [Ferrovibrio sp.]HLT77868.1 ABC-F family ATP-binding cassette domain-containing protein [Ferrovibrio sp.]